MKKLSNMKVGTSIKVLKVCGEGAVKRRIMDMGITKGANIFVRKTAPLGDPMEIYVRGYELTIRKEDANMVLVEESE
ncbi:FeoA family protein [[Clostridium] colinum]|uniref:FeoA family protein n=1 Tax=[Clostridium] colinum TaxID=36835 RepID=UPI0020245CC9|nr:FeoA domain-containing protein [[Clostridium] colinum]